jgi:hypothetical protein
MTLASSGDPSVYGSNLVLTAAVTSVSSGTVIFADGPTILGIANLDGSGKAAVSTAALSAGSHNITATYSGDPTFDGNISPVRLGGVRICHNSKLGLRWYKKTRSRI